MGLGMHMKPIPSLSFEIHPPDMCIYRICSPWGADQGWKSRCKQGMAIICSNVYSNSNWENDNHPISHEILCDSKRDAGDGNFSPLTPPSRKKAFSLVFRAAPCLSFVGAGQMSRSAAEGQQAAKNPSLLVLPTGKPTWLWKITMFWIYIKYQRLISVAMFNYQKNPEDIALGVWFGAMSGSYQEEYHHGASKNRNHTRSADPLTIGWTWGLPPHYLGVPEIDQKLITAWNVAFNVHLYVCLTSYFISSYIASNWDFEGLASWLANKIGLVTGSTPQGGGGSFKNRKPIGEVGCCESRMAERIHWWTERWLELCFLEWLQWLQWSPHLQLLDVVWCSAAVVVVVM